MWSLVGKTVGEIYLDTRTLQRVHHKRDAYEYERYAEPLSHIESHGGLKVHLIVFDKLYEESMKNTPNISPGRSSAFFFQYIHMSSPNRAK